MTFRVGGTAVISGLLAAVTGSLSPPPFEDRAIIAVVAVVRLALSMTLVFFGLRLVPAGRSSVLAWTASLWTVPVARMVLGERVGTRRWTGLVIGVAGVVILSEAWTNDWGRPDVLVGTGLLLGAAFLNAATSVFIGRHDWQIGQLQALPWQMAGATVILTGAAVVVEDPPVIDWSPSLIWILLYQSVLASGLAFWAHLVVLRHLSAVTANLTMMGIPVVGSPRRR